MCAWVAGWLWRRNYFPTWWANPPNPQNAPTPGPCCRPLLVKGVTCLTLQAGRIARKVSHANGAHTLHQLGAAPDATPRGDLRRARPAPAVAGGEEAQDDAGPGAATA